MWKIVFPKSRIFCKASPLQLFHWNSCKIVVYCFRETRRGGLVRPASKSCRFSHHPLRVPKAWHRNFAACGQRSGLLALNLANIFKKMLDQKTFICLRLVYCNPISMLLSCHVSRETLLLGKPPKSGSARLGHIPSLPWESQLPLKPWLLLQPSDFEGNCDSSDFLLDFCFISWCSFDLLRKCGLLAHTSAAFLKNCCTEKLFVCLRLVYCNPISMLLSCHVMFHVKHCS